MIFVNRRNRNSTFNRNKLTNFIIPINENKYNSISSENISKPKNVALNKEERIKEMLWGEPTWYFFHTIAEKIKENHFNQLKKELFDHIKAICNNLPCPDCANHATAYMNKVNFDAIRNKEQLKMLFFKFHNEVNANKNYELFEYTDLHDKYSSAITINIIRNFFYHFSQKQFNVRLDTSNYQRRILLKELKMWLEKYHYCFDE